MPPKRANKRAAPASPVRQAPSRSAKTRSAASTASMYKEAAEYHDVESTEDEQYDQHDNVNRYKNVVHDSLSDHISEPDDVISNTSEEDIGVMEVDSDDLFESKVTTKGRSGPAKKGNGKATPSKASSSTRSGQKKSAEEASTSSSSFAKTSSTRITRTGGSKIEQTQLQPISKSTAVTARASSATSGVKRKATNLRFALGSTTLASSSSSVTSTSRKGASSPVGPKAGSNNSSRSNSNVSDDEPWEEKYAPKSIDQVSVHKGKIKDVREWLEKFTAPGNLVATGGAILVLTGPAGSGKTTVLRMLAKEMDLNIVEWINSVNENNIIQRPAMPGQDSWRSSSIDEEYIPVMRAFEEFFARAHRFQPLQASAGDSPTNAQPSTSGAIKKKNIILIEDLPPVSAYSSRKIFQDTISKFAGIGGNRASAVLVIIVSDVFSKQSTELLFSSTTESRDPALTIRTLLPVNLLNRIDSSGRNASSIMQIKFNPIAVTFQRKALKNLIDREFRGSTLAFAPDTAEINQIIEIHDGDIRAAINALQFLCLLKTKDRQKYRDAALRLEEEDAELGVVGGGSITENIQTLGQDSSLGIFHAVARVLYNKRDWNEPSEVFDSDLVRVPKQSKSKQRPRLRFNPEKELIEKLPIEPDLYTLMLHQNYSRHLKTIEECNTAMEYLIVADHFGSSSTYTQAAQMQPYMSSVAVRGLLFAPKTAGPANASGVGGGAKKHWWPELFAVNRTMRSNDQIYNEVAADLSGQEAHGLSAGHIYGPGCLPKAVIRQEIVPMLHRCVSMNPYMPIMNQVLRPSSKNFVRNQAGGYGLKIGMGQKKEFGEGDEGFTEDLAGSPPSFGGSVSLFDASGSPLGPSNQQDAFRRPRQHPFSYTNISTLPPDDDPIQDFSD